MALCNKIAVLICVCALSPRHFCWSLTTWLMIISLLCSPTIPTVYTTRCLVSEFDPLRVFKLMDRVLWGLVTFVVGTGCNTLA